MDSSEKIEPEVLEGIFREIEKAGGREVLFIGRLDPDTRRVNSIFAAARGSYRAVPALAPQMEKGDVVIHNHPSGVLEPSEADLDVASWLGNQGIGFWIIDNSAQRLYAVGEPVMPEIITSLGIESAAQTLLPGGTFSKVLQTYECRPSQVELLRLFVKALNEDAVASAEAGTGVGKSFAYLIPALLWTTQNKERVVIATATINLQQQLVEKDIPFVQRVLGTKVKCVLVKGRRNYLCPTRLAEEIHDPADSSTLEPLHRIAEWAAQTKTGDVTELSFMPADGLWGRICSDAEACQGMRCAQKEGCFLLKSRREAAGAGILVANHHLLFADLALRVNGFGFDTTAVLPPFHRLIFDEAHNLEKSATSYFSWEFSRPFLQKIMSRLYRKKRSGETGLILSFQGLTTQTVDYTQIPPLTNQIAALADRMDFLALEGLGERQALRLTEENLELWKESLEPGMAALQQPVLQLLQTGQNIVDCFEDEKEVPSDLWELKSNLRKLEDLSQVLDKFKNWQEDKENVYWLEKVKDQNRGSSFVNWIVSPLSVRSMFNDAVFRPFRSVLMTSATLTVQDKFNFWGGRIGLDRVEPERRIFGRFLSPFDYKNRVLLGIPSDFPSPDALDYQEALETYVTQLLQVSKGSALVLFTSYESLKRAHQAIAPVLARQGISVYRQGEEERSRLLERFKLEISSVLFATDSFWEGVDTPGDTLRLLIICRLPFRVPTEPVLAARLEDLERRGMDAFMGYSLPESVTRFKQGFGRLIRHTDDSGVCIVLDNRLIRKNYGRIFIDSLPETQRAVEPQAVLLNTTQEFLEKFKN